MKKHQATVPSNCILRTFCQWQFKGVLSRIGLQCSQGKCSTRHYSLNQWTNNCKLTLPSIAKCFKYTITITRNSLLGHQQLNRISRTIIISWKLTSLLASISNHTRLILSRETYSAHTCTSTCNNGVILISVQEHQRLEIKLNYKGYFGSSHIIHIQHYHSCLVCNHTKYLNKSTLLAHKPRAEESMNLIRLVLFGNYNQHECN